jgi:phosphoglycerate-specific signal transduction histidine kinase
LLIQIKRQAKTSHAICTRNGAVHRVIVRARDEAAARRQKNSDNGAVVLAFRSSMQAGLGSARAQMLNVKRRSIAASAGAALRHSGGTARARLIYVNA